MTIPKLLFVLLGNNGCGKTNFQRYLLWNLCNQWYDRLPRNVRFPITHGEVTQKYKNAFFSNRSVQEQFDSIKSIPEYFEKCFQDTEITFVSSHLNSVQVGEIIEEGRLRYFNVIALFFSNSIQSDGLLNSQISKLNWNERIHIDNQWCEPKDFENQITGVANSFTEFLTKRLRNN